MSHAVAEPPALPLLDEQTAREHADTLRSIGERYGITELRFASPGRLVAHVGDDRDMIDMVDFEIDVEDHLGRHADVFSDSVLTNRNVSPDLVAAQPL